MKKILTIIIMLCVVVTLSGCGKTTNQKLNITVKVYDADEKMVYEKKHETNKKILLDALEELSDLKIVTENSDYGKFIVSIYGINQESDYFWNYYINDDYAMTGVSSYKIKDDDVISFRFEMLEWNE